MKKLISVLLCVSLFVLLIPSVFAKEDTRVCVSRVTYEEVTDVDEILQLALIQMASQPMLFAEDIGNDTIRVSQLLEKREYSDGSEEETYSDTTLQLTDNSGVPMTIPRILETLNQQATDSGYSIVLTNTINYTANTSTFPVQCRFNYIETAVVCPISSTVKPTSGNHYCDPSGNNKQWGYFNFTTAGERQSWRMYSSDSNFYNLGNGGPYMELSSQSSIDLTNGRYIAVDNHIA